LGNRGYGIRRYEATDATNEQTITEAADKAADADGVERNAAGDDDAGYGGAAAEAEPAADALADGGAEAGSFFGALAQ
jgi:hypothetical protein